MCGDAGTRSFQIRHGIGRTQLGCGGDVQPERHIAGEGIVRRGLIRDEVEGLAAAGELRHDFGRVAEQPDREATPVPLRRADARERVVQRVGRLVEVARLQATLDPGRIDLHAENGGVEQRPGERLCAAHPAQAGGEDRPSGETGGAEMPLRRGREGLVRALENPLRSDVDPASGRHLAEHRQPEPLQPAELVPGRPARDDHRVGDQDTRRGGMGAEDADRLAALDEEGFLRAEPEQGAHDPLQRLVAPCSTAGAAVDDERLGMLGHLPVEVVEQHPERCLRRPRAGVELRAARRPDP